MSDADKINSEHLQNLNDINLEDFLNAVVPPSTGGAAPASSNNTNNNNLSATGFIDPNFLLGSGFAAPSVAEVSRSASSAQTSSKQSATTTSAASSTHHAGTSSGSNNQAMGAGSLIGSLPMAGQMGLHPGIGLVTSSGGVRSTNNNNLTSQIAPRPACAGNKVISTAEEKAKASRERNREHARSTRLRKKAYVNKLKELVEHLHTERTEEARKRKFKDQQEAEKTRVRKSVIVTFLKLHSNFEPSTANKWYTIMEDDAWLKQPVTPYRYFRREDLEQDCRVTRGVPNIMADAASMAVMIENIGSRSSRWAQIKRRDFHLAHGLTPPTSPELVGGVSAAGKHRDVTFNKYQPAISSLSSGSGNGSETSSNGSNENNGNSETGNGNNGGNGNGAGKDERLHDYNAPSLPDPCGVAVNNSGRSPSYPDENSENSASSDAAVKPVKKNGNGNSHGSKGSGSKNSNSTPPEVVVAAPDPTFVLPSQRTPSTAFIAPIAKSGGISHNVVMGSNKEIAVASVHQHTVASKRLSDSQLRGDAAKKMKISGPTKIVTESSSAQSIGKKDSDKVIGMQVGSSNNGGENSTSTLTSSNLKKTSSDNSNVSVATKAYYHVNEDDMIITGDVLMCTFTLRSKDAVSNGAMTECIMPGMLRAQFSSRNKLKYLELTYDSMGFMQQLERASGSEVVAQIVPNGLEMAFAPNATEGRIITTAQPPYPIVSINEPMTITSMYTQRDAEGKTISQLFSGARTLAAPDADYITYENGSSNTKTLHKYSEVVKGFSACGRALHYDKESQEFINFICSYPLTNGDGDITHILHVCRDLTPQTHSDDMKISGICFETNSGTSSSAKS